MGIKKIAICSVVGMLLLTIMGCGTNSSSRSTQQLIEKFRAEVEAHRNGAEPSDDLTMMCLYIAQ